MKLDLFLGPIKPIWKGFCLMQKDEDLSEKQKQKMFRAITDIAMAAITAYIVVAYPRPGLERFELGCCVGLLSIGAGLLVLTGSSFYRGALLCSASLRSLRSLRCETAVLQAVQAVVCFTLAAIGARCYKDKAFRGGALYQMLFQRQ